MTDNVNSETNLANMDFLAELEAVNNAESTEHGRVATLKAPQTQSDRNVAVRDISTSALFGDSVLDGRIPELTQSFVIQKSKQDKLVEMGQIAQEMFETKRVSRSSVIALESTARELLPVEDAEQEDRKVIVSDHEVKMFTEEPSQIEAQEVIGNTQAAIDRIVGELRSSAIELGEKLIATTKQDQVERQEKIYKSTVVFNQAIIKFLQETSNDSLEGANLKFRRDLRWGDLMSLSLSALKYGGLEDNNKIFETIITSFDGTSAETFVKELAKFMAESNNSFSVLQNFAFGTNSLVRNSEDSYESIKQAKGANRSLHFTVGDLFSAFGSERFNSFYQRLNDCINGQLTATASAVELLKGKTDINQIISLTSELRAQQETIMTASANMAVLNRVQYMIIQFLNKF